MNISIDLVAILIQCLVLAYYLGKFSEKISNVEKGNTKVLAKLDALNNDYLTAKEGTRLEGKVDAAWKAIDYIKEEIVPSLREVIVDTISKHTNSCTGYGVK